MNLKPISLLCTLLAASGLAQASSLATLPTNMGFGVSGDGRYAVYTGSTGSVVRYELATGISTDLGGTGVGAGAGTASGGRLVLSGDGMTVLGALKNPTLNAYEGAVYDGSGWHSAGSLGVSLDGTASTGWDMSSDGRYVVGFAYNTVPGSSAVPSQAFIADRTSGSFVNLADNPSLNVPSRANAVSNNGSVVVGYSTMSDGVQAGSIWRRQANGSYQRTELSLAGEALNGTQAVSNNGLWAAGNSFNFSDPYRVNVATGAIDTFAKLRSTSSSSTLASVAAISEDGQTIIGTQRIGNQPFVNNLGFIWTAAGGTQDIDAYFSGFGIDPTNHYNFISPLSMSDDAMTFTGIARDNLTGGQVGFVVSLTAAVPEPGSYALLAAGLGVLGFVARRRRGSDASAR